MTREEAYRFLLEHPKGVKYRGSKFGDRLRATLCQEDIINMKDGYMVLTEWGLVVVKDRRAT